MPFGQSDADVMKEQLLRTPEQQPMGDQGQMDPSDPEVAYMTGDQGPFMCSHCINFQQPNACSKVAGEIDPNGCCNLYESSETTEGSQALPPEGIV